MKKALLVSAGLILLVAMAAVAGGTQDITPKSKITLTYAYWNLGTPEENNLERRMIAAWNAANPMIQVEVAANMDYGKYAESLGTAAAAGTMPDVFAIQNFPSFLANDWLADLTSTVSKDAEWKTIPKSMSDSVYFNGKAYGLPYAAFMWGFWINKDIFARENVPAPTETWTLADFERIVKTLAKPDKPLIGYTEELEMPNWYPIAANPSLGYYTWDGKAFHLDSPEFKAGIALARSFWTNGQVWEAMPKDAKDKIGAGWHGEAFNKGYAAMRYDGAWTYGDAKNWTFKWDFIPIPGGKLIFVPDYLGISKSTKNLPQAFAFAKWMTTFSKKGMLYRLEAMKADPKLPLDARMPLTKDADVVNAYFDLIPLATMKKLYANIENSVFEPVKVVPGYVMARWDAPVTADKKMGDMIWGSIRGDVKIEDVAAQLNKIANDQYQAAIKTLPK